MPPRSTVGTLTQVVLGVLVADFLVALVHWFEDAFLPYDPSDSWLARVSRDNEMHHFIPYAITTHSWLDNMRNTALLSAVLGAVLFACLPSWSMRHRAGIAAALVTGTLSNLLHRFQHERSCNRPALVRALQGAGVMCSSEQHKKHHEDPRGRYGVVLGFTNAVYDGLGVWRGLESVLRACGWRPAPKPGVASYKQHYDPWLQHNMALDCPYKLRDEQLRAYGTVLQKVMQ